MARPISLIRAAGVAAFAAPVAEAGAPVDRLWARVGISPDVLLDADRWVPLHALIQFGEAAAADLSVPDLGLRIAERSAIGSLGVFGATVRAQPTLKRAIETATLLVSSYDSGERVWTVPERDGVRVCRRVRSVDGCFRQADLFTLGLMVDLVRSAAGPEWRPDTVELQSPGVLASGNEMISRARITTGRPATAIFLPRELLHRPVRRVPATDPPSGPPVDTWRERPHARDFVASVREAISVFLDSGRTEIAAVSRVAGMSPRSVQRGLSAAGTSYARLVDDVRMEKALDLVEDPDLRIIDVALSLGYSDQAHFTRAFRRWTSVTPLEYRKGAAARAATPGLSA